MVTKPHLLIVEARFYAEIADELLAGATQAIAAAGATHEIASVPGALEIPAAIAMAMRSAETGGKRFDGYVALGCVIRGETSHYDIVAGESARALMDLSVRHAIALGNGVLTVENFAQAWARANTADMNKGGGAAGAALAMIALRRKFGPAGA